MCLYIGNFLGYFLKLFVEMYVHVNFCQFILIFAEGDPDILCRLMSEITLRAVKGKQRIVIDLARTQN